MPGRLARVLNAASSSELDLREYIGALKRRKAIVLLTMGVLVALALASSFIQEPIYAASAELLLQPKQSESPFDANTGARVDPARALATDIEVLESQLVQAEVRSRLGSAPPVSAKPVGQTDVVRVTAESTDPKRAAEVANTYASAYIDVRRQQAVDGLLAAGEEIQVRVTDLQQQIRGLDDQVNGAPPADQGAIRESVSEQRQLLVQQQSLFKQTLDKLTVDANLASGGAQLVGSAVAPSKPARPKPMRNAILAGILGLMLGVGLAFLAEYLDDSIKTREDLERQSAPVPVIALIPAVGTWKERDEVRLVSITDPTSAAAEAYRTLRTAIQFVALDRPLAVLQITSSNASEGKTTTLANLGVALAKAGQRVILVCCDLRRPRLHDFFGLPNDVGFTSLLLGNAPLSKALQTVPDVPRLRLLASGPLPPNPSELLSSGRTKEVFAALRAEADIVLIDSPPVLPVTDALVLFRQVDATLMVFSAGRTTQKQASTALAMAKQVDAPLVGTVLNGVTAPGGYGAQYSYGYRSEAEEGGPQALPGPGSQAAKNGARRDGASLFVRKAGKARQAGQAGKAVTQRKAGTRGPGDSAAPVDLPGRGR
ncbi:MAG TPA: polysaccharide biosynthesis tyrosine autokinase [Acidimicrobiales bacterium]|nr:polysaccharide biosynthesis tyrosine autokinase [Acidimicrobiales bacterium]